MNDYEFDSLTLIVVGIIVVFVVTLVVLQIVGMFRRKRAGADLMSLHPDAARIYTQLGGPMAGALKTAVGMKADLSINSVDNAHCGFVLDTSGGFTPVLAGTHMLRITAVTQYPGIAQRRIVGDMSLSLVPYQCVLVAYDKEQKGFYAQELGFSYEL